MQSRTPSSPRWKARWLAGLVLCLPASALGQTTSVPGFNLERLELNPSAVGSLALDTAELLPEGGFRFSLAGHYEQDPLVLLRNGARLGAVVGNRASVDVTGAYAIKDWLELGLQVPVVAWQRGDDLSVANVAQPAANGLGTPEVSARLGLLSSHGAGVFAPGQDEPLELALQVGLGLPVGSADALARDPGLGVTPKLLIGKQLDGFLLSGEISSLLRQKVALGPDELGNQLGFGASVASVGHPVGGELTFRSYVPLTHTPAAGFELLAGLRYRFAPYLEGFALGGMGFGLLQGTPAFRVLLGLAYGSGEVSPRKPLPPPPAPVSVAPPPPAAVPPPPAPEPAAVSVDTEPAPEPEPVAVAPEPEPAPKDTDNDGVPDVRDNCPTEAGPESNQGCPVKVAQLVVITKEKLEIKDKIYFEFGKARLLPRSFTLLDQIVHVLQEHPDLRLLAIEGHTDNIGSAAYNQKLSQARAEAVRSYLVQKGVDAGRLLARGYGMERPVDTNATPKGRENNRRVEFNILESSSQESAQAPEATRATEEAKP